MVCSVSYPSLKVKVKVKPLSRVRLFATPWTVAYQAPRSMGFSRQEYWSGLPFPSPGDLITAAKKNLISMLLSQIFLRFPPDHCIQKSVLLHSNICIRLPGEGNGTPLQYSCLENPMDGGAW